MSSRTLPGRVAVVLGTRPEVIKLAGIIDLLGPRALVVHTGQHYDPSLAADVFTEMGLAPPQVQLHVGGSSRGRQVGDALTELEELFRTEQPAAVVVQGDTNATLAGALAADAAEIPLVHVEAGLRSFDRAMPEERNRVVTDHLATLLCAATPLNARNLAREGLSNRVVVTGNTVVEAVQRMLPSAEQRAKIAAEHGCGGGGHVLATIHRPENTDDPARLQRILEALADVDAPVVLSLHPRTRLAVERHGLRHLLASVHVVEPLSSPVFLSLASTARLLVSDSGGVQEECTVLKRPLLVVRNSTERPEALEDFAAMAGPSVLRYALADALGRSEHELERLRTVPSPYGDGRASELVVRHLDEIVVGARA